MKQVLIGCQFTIMYYYASSAGLALTSFRWSVGREVNVLPAKSPRVRQPCCCVRLNELWPLYRFPRKEPRFGVWRPVMADNSAAILIFWRELSENVVELFSNWRNILSVSWSNVDLTTKCVNSLCKKFIWAAKHVYKHWNWSLWDGVLLISSLDGWLLSIFKAVSAYLEH